MHIPDGSIDVRTWMGADGLAGLQVTARGSDRPVRLLWLGLLSPCASKRADKVCSVMMARGCGWRLLAVLAGLWTLGGGLVQGAGTNLVYLNTAFENAALETWLEAMIRSGQRPHLALDLHNDGGGHLHISRPPVDGLSQHVARMTVFEELLRRHTWFTEGSTPPSFRHSGTMGDGWLERYGIDAVVHELNCNWIASLNDYPSAAHWRDYGARLARGFAEYFDRVKP